MTEITTLTGIFSEVTDFAAATVLEVELAGRTLTDTIYLEAGWTALTVLLR